MAAMVCRGCRVVVTRGVRCYGTLCEDCWVEGMVICGAARLYPTPDPTLEASWVKGGPFPQGEWQGPPRLARAVSGAALMAERDANSDE